MTVFGYCPNCDAPITDGSNIFCPFCKANLSKYKKLNDQPRDTAQKFNEKGGKVVTNIILAVGLIPVLLILIICMFSFCMTLN